MGLDLESLFHSSKGHSHKLGRLIAKAWADPEFESLVKNDPKGALKSVGIDVPDDVPVTEIPIPPKPEGLSDEQLSQANADGGSCAASAGSLTCPSCSAGTAGSAH